jgi:hypothetical protein
MITSIVGVSILSGCGVPGDDRPSANQLAQFCDVQLGELEKAKAELKADVAKDALKVGSCSLVKGSTGKIRVVAIRQPPEASDQ